MPYDSPPSVVNVYIDGYNFYYSISKRRPPFLKLGWCDFSILAEKLVEKAFPGASVGAVKYFTANVGDFGIKPGEAERQRLWLAALKFGTRNPVLVIKGFHAKSDDKPRQEKQTDIKLAISIVRDTITRPDDSRHTTFASDPYLACDGVILISDDRDLDPPLEMAQSYGVSVAKYSPNKIEEEDLKDSMLPDRILHGDGPEITWQRYVELKNAGEQLTERECFQACSAEAVKSDDKETQVGCIIYHPRRGIVARGHNGLPDRVLRSQERLSGPGKRIWMEHAERNAINDAAKRQTRIDGSTMYVDLMPCADCARGVIQAGIREVVVSHERMRAYSGSFYAESQMIAKVLFEEAGVFVRMA